MDSITPLVERLGAIGILGYLILIILPRTVDRIISSNEGLADKLSGAINKLSEKLDSAITEQRLLSNRVDFYLVKQQNKDQEHGGQTTQNRGNQSSNQ